MGGWAGQGERQRGTCSRCRCGCGCRQDAQILSITSYQSDQISSACGIHRRAHHPDSGHNTALLLGHLRPPSSAVCSAHKKAALDRENPSFPLTPSRGHLGSLHPSSYCPLPPLCEFSVAPCSCGSLDEHQDHRRITNPFCIKLPRSNHSISIPCCQHKRLLGSALEAIASTRPCFRHHKQLTNGRLLFLQTRLCSISLHRFINWH